MSKTTAIIIGIIILLFGGFVTWSIVNSSQSIDFDQYDPAFVIEPSESNGNIGDHVRGKIDSPVVFVEYADFQCPGCAASYPNIETLFKEYGDRVAFVFRNFPLKDHPNSRAAASAAESAGLQGYFFEMVATLFANQAAWTYSSGAERTNIFADLFRQIAPDGDVLKFKDDMGNSNIAKKISFDYNLGVKRSGVKGTPSFFINGEYIEIPQSTTASESHGIKSKMIDAKLKEFGLPSGPATSENL